MEVEVGVEAPELDRSAIIGSAQQSQFNSVSSPTCEITTRIQKQIGLSAQSSNLAAASAVSNPPG